MEIAIIIFFLAIFLGLGFLGLIIFLFWRWRRSKNNVSRLTGSGGSGSYASVQQSHDTNDFYQNNETSDFESSANYYSENTEPEIEKPKEAAGFVSQTETAADYSNYPTSSTEYSTPYDSGSGYDSASSSSDYSSSSDSGSSSSSD